MCMFISRFILWYVIATICLLQDNGSNISMFIFFRRFVQRWGQQIRSGYGQKAICSQSSENQWGMKTNVYRTHFEGTKTMIWAKCHGCAYCKERISVYESRKFCAYVKCISALVTAELWGKQSYEIGPRSIRFIGKSKRSRDGAVEPTQSCWPSVRTSCMTTPCSRWMPPLPTHNTLLF